MRPIKTAVLPAAKVACVSKKGEVFKHHFVKWLKDSSDAWILLVGFDAAGLPAAKDVAAARLALFVEEAREKAPMQAATVMLDAPFEPDQPYEFSKLGASVGSTVVQERDGVRPAPPRRYEIDVTRTVRSWAGGAEPCGPCSNTSRP